MALAKAFSAVDMYMADVWYGEVTTASDSTIRITSGDWVGTYKGQFSYDYYGDVYGVLNSYTESYDGDTWFSVTEIGRDANVFQDFIDRGDGIGALSYVLSGPDILRGSQQNDRLLGFNGDDLIYGASGRDHLYGGGGHDVINGGAGSDRIWGQSGDDRIHGNQDADVLRGQMGSDRLAGGHGDDKLFGNLGEDVLLGGQGDDIHRGGIGADRLRGGAGDDELFGGVGADRMLGGAGQDEIVGGGGNDRLNGGLHDDILTGGRHSDVFIFRGDFGNDTVTDFSVTQTGERIDLSAIAAIHDFSDLVANHMDQIGSSTVIDDGRENSITLLDVNLFELDTDHFLI